MDGLHLFSAKLPRCLAAIFAKLNAATYGPARIGRSVLRQWDPIFIAGGAPKDVFQVF